MRRIINPCLLSAALLFGTMMASDAVAQAVTPPPHEKPEAFVHRLFAQYRTSAGMERVNKNFADPDFVHLMKENGALFGAEGDADLDYDPICQCQDVDRSAYVLVDGKPSEDGGGYIAHMRRGKGKDQTDWQLVLKPIGGSWKVYDVIDQGGSVRALLIRHNECVKAAKRDHKSIDGCAS